ncbi:stalk domain-containing protein [Paenibacillus sp. S-38]|uniref:stalk domain-containing protein n=1 Tax=Paenibacillus sp. S-38 TaxID=3416710 RepID=UPI003CF448E5
MKRGIAGLALCTALSAGTAASASDAVQAVLFDVTYKFGGKQAQLGGEYVSLNYNGHAYVPIRFVAEQAGLKVEFDEQSKTVKVGRAGSYVAEAAALELAKLSVPDAKGAAWKAELLEAAGAEGQPVWRVTGTDPEGRRTEVKLNAETGERIAMKELGVSVPQLGEAYGLILSTMADHSRATGGPEAYIAVDHRGLEKLGEAESGVMLGMLGKYQVPVLLASLDELKAQGRVDAASHHAIDGVLLGIEKTVVEGSRLVVDAYLYKSALGAESRQFTLEHKEGGWKVVEDKLFGIS